VQKAHDIKQKKQDKPKRVTFDKATKQLHKEAEALQGLLNACRLPFTHIRWLQERFPEAKYDDVTGLCKLASLEAVQAQDYSLNAGRYVGVVIEEDGKTEEEFLADLQEMNSELQELNETTYKLNETIQLNLKEMIKNEE
jgi:type I restriction enzyme M protein